VGGFRDTLEKFSSRSCKDSDIATLANNCKQLKCLDISCSTGVSNRIADYILTFEHLEELNLYEVSCLDETSLLYILTAFTEVDISKGIYSQNDDADILSSSEDMFKDTGDSSKIPQDITPEIIPSEIIPSAVIPSEVTHSVESAPSDITCPPSVTPSLSDTVCSPVFRSQLLQKFGCSWARKRHIKLISQFSNLTSLILSKVRSCVLTPLKDLKNLRSFGLWYSRFVLVEDLLKAIGTQLDCLSITDVVGTDFDFIRLYCRSVACLHLCFTDARELIMPRNWNIHGTSWHRRTAYPSVVSLQIFLNDLAVVQYLLTHFRNLENLFFSNNFDVIFFESLLQRMYNPHLRTLYWGDEVAVTFHGRIASVKKFYSDGVKGVQNIVV
jgi:hypothetical protein